MGDPDEYEDPFDRLEAAAEAVARRAVKASSRVQYERANRVGLLWVHAIVATLAGVQQALWGTAAQIEAIYGPVARFYMAPVAVIGGLVLTFGLTRRPRSVRLEGVGLAFIALWDGAMTLGLAYARWHQQDFHFLGPHERLPDHYASPYPVAVYGGLLALLLIHLWTLRLLKVRGFKGRDGDESE